MTDTKKTAALALKAAALAMAVLSVVFIALDFTDNYLHVIFLAIGLAVLSIASIMDYNK
jgi:hypothetical protein